MNAIICVDDESLVLVSLKTALKNEFGTQFIYESALNAYDAMDIIDDLYKEGVRIILIISDWLMPGIKGDEFLIQVYEKYPDIKSILLTGMANEKSIESLHEKVNLVKIVYKPWTKESLIDLIRREIGDVT